MASTSSLYIPGETTVPYQCTPGPQEEVVATVLRKVFAGLSVLGSGFIIVTLVQKWRRSPASIDPYCRIMLGLSVYDIIWSFFPWFMGSWLMPVETGHWGASGNTQTCTLQGFFFWLGVPGAQWYQIILSLHTLLLVTFRWTPRDFHLRIERWVHVVIFGVALVLATVPLFFQGYNPECGTCLPAPLPIWCGDWIFWGDGKTECLRGKPQLSEAYYTIYLTNLSIMGVFCTYAMIQVYWTVRRQEDRNARYTATFSSQQQPQPSAAHRAKSKRIRRIMILYTFGFYLCWIVPSFIIHFAKQGTPMMRMSYILLPFQGFFNMIIFLQPKCVKYQRDHPGTWLVMAYVYVLFGTCAKEGCLERMIGARRMQALRRSSSRIRNPFRISSHLSGTMGTTEVTDIVDPFDDDGIGFNDFNAEPSVPRPMPIIDAEQDEHETDKSMALDSEREQQQQEEEGDVMAPETETNPPEKPEKMEGKGMDAKEMQRDRTLDEELIPEPNTEHTSEMSQDEVRVRALDEAPIHEPGTEHTSSDTEQDKPSDAQEHTSYASQDEERLDEEENAHDGEDNQRGNNAAFS